MVSRSILWHSKTVEEVEQLLKTTSERGLTKEEAKVRLQKNGSNALPPPKRESLFFRIIRHFISPIALVLVCATIATTALSHYTDALVILTALLVNVLMGLIQEGRASHAFEALQKSEARFAVVIRSGEPFKIPSDELVVGDVVVLSPGNAVPADIRLIQTTDLSINESMLSGEWLAVDKKTEPAEKDAPLTARVGMAYAGTLVSAGSGRGILVATGTHTEFGQIAKALGKRDDSVTPLMRDISSVARFIVGAVAVVLVLIVILGVVRGLPLEETLLTAIALAVASVPEGLPAAVTVVLALGMERILRSGGLVRNLLAAETLGTTSIILTDKTGTLTEGRMTLEAFITKSAVFETVQEQEPRRLLTSAVLASHVYIEEREEAEADEKLIVHGRPIEEAIVIAGLKAGISQPSCIDAYPVLDELNFDSARRFGGRLVREGEGSSAYITGAPELLLSAVSHVEDSLGSNHRMSTEARAHFEAKLTEATSEGKRVIAVIRVRSALREFPPEKALLTFLTEGSFIGLLVFSDQIRSEAKAAISDMHTAGARVVMVTGDNPETAFYIARSVGIASSFERAYTGADLAERTDEEVLELVRNHSVFARVTPNDKLRIAEILRDAGEVVAMTGDGVNDAPALRAAAIGVAVGSGTDVAKEASDLVLLKNSFEVITSAIREGRRLRENFKKIFAYMLSTNFSEVILIAVALIFGLPLPILPTQILWSNLIEGGLMNFAFAFEPLYPSAMKRNPKDPEIARVLSPKLITLIITVGTVTAGILIGIYFYLLSRELPLEQIQSLMFIAVSVNCIFMAFSMKSFSTPLWRLSLFTNPFLLVSLALSLVLLLSALYVPFLQSLIHVSAPSGLSLTVLIGFGLTNLATIELVKWFLFIRAPRR